MGEVTQRKNPTDLGRRFRKEEEMNGAELEPELSTMGGGKFSSPSGRRVSPM